MNPITKLPRKFWLTALLAGSLTGASAQRVGLKTNALYWAAATPNIGLELRLNRHITLNLEGAGNYLNLSTLSSRGFMVAPEGRYWFSARPQAGHFAGVMALAAYYKTTFNGTVHNGDATGAGLTYGYAWVLGSRWSLEGTVGLGLLHIKEKKYADGTMAPMEANNSRWLPAPLKAGLTVTYLIR